MAMFHSASASYMLLLFLGMADVTARQVASLCEELDRTVQMLLSLHADQTMNVAMKAVLKSRCAEITFSTRKRLRRGANVLLSAKRHCKSTCL